MLSFELSAIDIVLVIAAIVILALYLIKPTVSKARSRSSAEDKKTHGDSGMPSISGLEKPKASSELIYANCLHSFGYLKNIPKGNSIPEECYVCPRMVQCAAGARDLV